MATNTTADPGPVPKVPLTTNPKTDWVWRKWLAQLRTYLINGPSVIPIYTIATLPDASLWCDGSTFSSLVYVSDAAAPDLYAAADTSAGPTIAFSDGTNWISLRDYSVVA